MRQSSQPKTGWAPAETETAQKNSNNAAVFALFMLSIGRRLLKRLGTDNNTDGKISQNHLALVLILVLASVLVTEGLGIHPLFDAFFLGVVMPKDLTFVHELRAKLEDTVIVLLPPLFFAYTGLRTTVGLISGPDSLLYVGLILLVAIGGKFGGASLASRVSGMSWREAGLSVFS